MLEAKVEARLKRIEGYGFEVFKLRTPGKSGAMDRLIQQPKWSPAPPVVVEIKKPGHVERPLQEARRDDWRARGTDVRDMCDTYEKIDALCDDLLLEAIQRWHIALKPLSELPPHILEAFRAASRRCIEAGRLTPYERSLTPAERAALHA